MTGRALAALAALGILSGCGSLTVQEDASARIEAALKAYAANAIATDPAKALEEYELKGTMLQIVGTDALQTGTFRRKDRLADGTRVESKGTFEAEWERQADGSWLVVRMTKNPPPIEVPKTGETP